MFNPNGRGRDFPAVSIMKTLRTIAAFLAVAGAIGCGPVQEDTPLRKVMVVDAAVNGRTVVSGRAGDVPAGECRIEVEFTSAVTPDEASMKFVSFTGGGMTVAQGSDDCHLVFTARQAVAAMQKYVFRILSGDVFGVNLVEDYTVSFTTSYDMTPKFPSIPDEELLTLVQQRTFGYFWDYAHDVSGLARERLGSGETVTTGGSGFGVMCIPIGIERGFITREEGAARLRKIVDFLGNKADRFHGVFPHWLNGTTGKVIPFSARDNGGDLVETAFLVQGLLTASAYFDRADEADIRSGIDTIWREVEWDWYLNGQDVLYWHWSPSDGWAMNLQIRGWNEGLIVYVLAASSPTHPVSADAYHKGWASNGGMRPSVNGPLFFAHYSFLGLDPRGLSDKYCADYFAHNVAHARYNYDYCVRNPGKHGGYSASSWGLTASDIPNGYAASSPSNDKGVIAPTAALASMPYTPEESMAALHTFYYIYGDRLWGKNYGFFDAFCLDSGWFASSYIAIDQGPIVVMIENYRSALCWKLFMGSSDVRSGLTKLGFKYE